CYEKTAHERRPRMNQHADNGNSRFLPSTPIRFPDGFEACWAGPNPSASTGFCFGSLDGSILLTDETGIPQLDPFRISASGEAINGVAGSQGCQAITTRQEVNFAAQDRIRSVFPCGAHHVTATSSGCFLVALGRNGIMAAQAPLMPETQLPLFKCEKAGFIA